MVARTPGRSARWARRLGCERPLCQRPDEFGHGPNNSKPDLVPDDSVDVTARDFGILADQLGA